jgi:DNA-binding CsgD family transcriptional regulator/tetratricopeptide (TPR) repeat protein
MILIEREDQLRSLEHLFLRCRSGIGGVAVVAGPLGSGKSCLLHSFAWNCAAKTGSTLLSAAASRAERHRPLGVMQQLFRSAKLPPATATQASRLIRDAELAAMLQDADPEVAGVVTAPMLHGLCTILLDHAEEIPVLIAVDDAQFADGPSLQCLSYVARRISSARIMMLLNRATGPNSPHPILDAELLSQSGCQQITVDRLSPSGVAELVGHQLGEEAAHRLAAEINEASGGNPLLVRALIDDCRATVNARMPEFTVGKTFARAVISLLYGCDRAMLNVARVLAVVEQPPPSELARMSCLDPETAARAAQALADAGLIVEERFRCAAVRDAVLGGMAADELADLHAQAAELRHFAGAPASTVAWHIMQSGRTESPWQHRVLREAAERAILEGDMDLAVGCLRLAYQTCADESNRVAIRAVLAQVQWRIDPAGSAVRHLGALTSAVREGRLTGSHAVATVYELLWRGAADEAVEILDKLGEDDDVEILKEIRNAGLWLRYLYPAGAGRPLRLPSIDSTSPTGANDPADTVLRTLVNRSTDGRAVFAAEELLQCTRLTDLAVWPLAAAIQVLIYADRLPAAAMWCESLIQESTRLHAPVWRALYTAVRAEIALRAGDPAQADECAQQALSLISRESWGVAIGCPLSTAVQAAIANGRYDVAASYLRVQLPTAMQETFLGTHYLNARGLFWLATDRVHAALGDFTTCGKQLIAWGLDVPALVPWRVNAARAHLRLGLRHEAGQLLHEQLDKLGTGMTATRGRSLRLLAAASDGRKRLGLLREAVEVLKQSGDQVELAQAFADLSQALHSAGDTGRARMMLRNAEYAAKRGRAGALPREALPPANEGQEAGTASAGDAHHRQLVHDLSDAERRVAVLAAIGYTNREISRRLFVTVSTVEQHLTRVYRKLQVNRRTDLPPALHMDLAETA